MIRYSVVLTFVGCIAIALNLLASQIASHMRVETTRVRMRDESKVDSATMSGIDMIESIKSSGAENGFFERWAGFQAAANIQTVKQLRNDSFFLSIPVLLQELSNAAILTIGVWLIMKGKFSVGMLVAFQSLLQQFMMPVESLLDIGQSIQETRTSMERVQDVMKYASDNSYVKTFSEDDITEFEKLKGTIELRHVTFGYSKLEEPLLKDFNLIIHPGDKVAFVGPSGCGKSTIGKSIVRLLKPTGGKIFFGEDDVTGLPPENRGVGMVFQNYALYPHLTVEKNIQFPLENLKGADKLSKEEMNKRVLEAAKLVQIDHLLERKPNELSGGQQQRVAIARALVKLPRVLLLDEPLSNLDARLRLQTREEIRRIQQETQITTIFVTHDQDEAMSISDMIVVMKDGIVQQIGKPQNVYDDPVNLFVAKFLGTPPINVFSGEVKNEQLYIGSEAVLSTPGVADQPVHVGIRPEGFILKEDGPLSCDLVRLEVMGRDVSIVSTHEKSQNVTIRSIIDADEGKSLPTGKVHFALKPAKVFLFCTDTEERIRF